MFKTMRFLVGAGLLCGATAALAGDLPPDMRDQVMSACRADYHQVCSYVVPGDGRVGRCLMDHETELSPPCLKAVKLAYAIEACLPDYRQFCGGVPRGPEAVQCLAGRMEVLAPECRRVVMANVPYLSPRAERYGSYEGGYRRGPVPYGLPPQAYSYYAPNAPRYEAPYPSDERYEHEGDRPDGSPYDGRHADGHYDRYSENPPYGDRPYSGGGYYEGERRDPYPQERDPYPRYDEREPIK
jgi:hypothetical protein